MLSKSLYDSGTVTKYEDRFYEVIRPLGHPMVLLDGATPVAALFVGCEGGDAFIVRRHGAHQFQAVVTLNEQPFSFTITNLLFDRRIVVNIFHGGSESLVNEITVYEPGQSVVTRGDCSNGMRKMFLGEVATGVTVGADAAAVAAGGATQGTHYDVRIYPAAGGGSDYRNATWVCTDVFCRPRVDPGVPQFRRPLPPYRRTLGLSDNDEIAEVSSRGGGSGGGFIVGELGRGFGAFSGQEPDGAWGAPMPPPPSQRRRPVAAAAVAFAPLPSVVQQQQQQQQQQRRYQPVACCAAAPPSDAELMGYAGGPMDMSDPPSPSFGGRDDDGDAVMDRALAARVRLGTEVVRDPHAQTLSDSVDAFDWERGSAVVQLTMSLITPDIEPLRVPSKAQVLERGLQLVIECINNRNAQLIASLTAVYPEDTCVICLDGQPDAVLVSCGHRGVHYACLRKCPKPDECPQCRQPVKSVVHV
jgi:hypothetical protein